MELGKMMNSYIVVKRTLVTTLLETVISSRFSFNGLSTRTSTIENKIKLNPSSKERLFGITSDQYENVLVKKFNYTMLLMRYYIYTNKLYNKSILLQDFLDKTVIKYRIENAIK